ncbi:hypothetical protein GEV33_010962 [Tenebrio molitor]|jgi:hypothetical protein|uniref:Uncharacterized protein n=1 Tax=Tenebrio molitor TaxID=7067 RepID=A0A8J6HBN2_TENMO|nr:hypothetical protein GEV33_010962 [Tenebrio molitor]
MRDDGTAIVDDAAADKPHKIPVINFANTLDAPELSSVDLEGTCIHISLLNESHLPTYDDTDAVCSTATKYSPCPN